MKDRLDKLLSVKSIVTIILTIIFAILATRGTISGQEFLTIFTTVIAFYFGTQSEKKNVITQEDNKGSDKNENNQINTH